VINRPIGTGARSTSLGVPKLREAAFTRAKRLIALPYDEAVAERLAGILAAAAIQGRKAGAMDAIIAATALAHNLAVWTQDGDFHVLQELTPALRVHPG
jgi:predicted nucleic acid-binding protein